MFAIMKVNEGLLGSGRVPSLTRPTSRLAVTEIAVLIFLGALAALTGLLPDMHLRVPGHAILRAVFPMALGLALVPRRWAGVIMGSSAYMTAFALRKAGYGGFGPGAIVSLTLTGPCLDLALFSARPGWPTYLGFVFAGITSNLTAMVVRGGVKAFTIDNGLPFETWWRQSIVTYPVCGFLAGLISAAVWFQLRGPGKTNTSNPGERP